MWFIARLSSLTKDKSFSIFIVKFFTIVLKMKFNRHIDKRAVCHTTFYEACGILNSSSNIMGGQLTIVRQRSTICHFKKTDRAIKIY